MSSTDTIDWKIAIPTVIATALVVAGANALNMALESDRDKLMARTKNRPIPAQRIKPIDGLIFGVVISSIGMIAITVTANPLAGLGCAIALLTYVFMYTPLKTKSTLCTLVGAIPGALPPVIGGIAIKGYLSSIDVILFMILFLWQLPHFLAIATLYLEDYKKAGFLMLPVMDRDGSSTTRQTLLQILALVTTSLAPSLLGISGSIYCYSAIALGLVMFFFGTWFWISRSISQARLVFRTSIIYLTLLLFIMIVDKR